MAELPTDIIIKILSKLPVKSLLRFQCVSKSWKSLIKSPNFINSHLNQTLISFSNRHLLISAIHYSLHSSELDHLLINNQLALSFSQLHPPLKPFNFVGSYNGVVCISDISQNNFFLFNPLTNSRHKVPTSKIQVPEFNLMVFGFGYDRINDDYKVLRIVQGVGMLDGSENNALVYSLKANSWKFIKSIQFYLYHGYCHGTFVNENLHYLVTKEPDYLSVFIAIFDVRTESFSVMDCPDYDHHRFVSNSLNTAFMLVELGGCLCLLMSSYVGDGGGVGVGDELMVAPAEYIDELDARVLDCVDFWVMKEYGNNESWVRLFSIRHPESIGSYKLIKPLVYSNDGSRILLEIDNSRYIWYDPKSKIVERISVHGVLSNGGLKAGIFIGSLVSLEDKVVPQKEGLLMKKSKKNDVEDRFLSKGFKLKL